MRQYFVKIIQPYWYNIFTIFLLLKVSCEVLSLELKIILYPNLDITFLRNLVLALWSWYICSIFSILRIFLNIVFDKKTRVCIPPSVFSVPLLLKFWFLKRLYFRISSQTTIIQNSFSQSGHAKVKNFRKILRLWIFLKQTLPHIFLF